MKCVMRDKYLKGISKLIVGDLSWDRRLFAFCQGHGLVRTELERRCHRGKMTEEKNKESLRPEIHDHHHQDSLFGNAFQAKSHFIVHPEWLSEYVNPPDSMPLNRPPWPWEQPRYRQNVQIPITYKAQTPEEQQEEKEKEDNKTPPPLPYSLPRGYSFAHPSIDDTKPYSKTTEYGAPVVDTTHYKLGY